MFNTSETQFRLDDDSDGVWAHPRMCDTRHGGKLIVPLASFLGWLVHTIWRRIVDGIWCMTTRVFLTSFYDTTRVPLCTHWSAWISRAEGSSVGDALSSLRSSKWTRRWRSPWWHVYHELHWRRHATGGEIKLWMPSWWRLSGFMM